jgi:hypothetical protein
MGNAPAPASSGRPDPDVPAVPDDNQPPANTRPAAYGGQIAQALVDACRRIKPPEKTAYNAYHKYWYTPAEGLIAAAGGPLADCGLALVPTEQALKEYVKNGEVRYELVRRFLLLHVSGESLPISLVWPVVPERGKPLDKACAIAVTLSVSYLLRDLLLVPRVDQEDDAAARQDRPQPAAARALPPGPPAQDGARAGPPPDADELATRLDELMRETGTSAETLAGWLVNAFGKNHWSQLDAPQKRQVVEGMERRAAKQRQQAAAGGQQD